MNFSNPKQLDYGLLISPIFGVTAPALIDLWKAQIAWDSRVGLPQSPSVEIPDSKKIEDLLK
jgi:hypothetical protein